MNFTNFTNRDLMSMLANVASIFRSKPVGSEKITEDYIGLAIAKSYFYGIKNPDGNYQALELSKVVFNSKNDVTLQIEGIVRLQNIPTNIGSGAILYDGLGALFVESNLIYDGRTSAFVVEGEEREHGDWIKKDAQSPKNFNEYEIAGIRSILDIWFNYDVAKTSTEFFDTDYTVLLASLSKKTNGNIKVALYLADNTGLPILGYNYFYGEGQANSYDGDIITITLFITINMVNVPCKILIDTTKLKFPSELIGDAHYAINNGVGLMQRYLPVEKKYKTKYGNYDNDYWNNELVLTAGASDVYTTCNDISPWNESLKQRNISIYLERLLLMSGKKYINFKSTKSIIKSLASRRYFHPEPGTNPADQPNYLENIHIETISDAIIGDDFNDVAISFNHISTNASESAGKNIFHLQIGDSVTWGAESAVNATSTTSACKSWEHVKELFELDNLIDSGDRIVRSIGTQSVRGITNAAGSFLVGAEGRSGWTTRDYLYGKTFDQGNPFYDVDKVGTVKFSLAKYLSRYKTIADDGITKLVVGSTAGTLVSDVDLYDVLTPNVITLQLGFNDEQANYATDMQLLIDAIKAEFPNMVIIISVIGATGTFYPELWQGWEQSGKDISLLEPMNVTDGFGYCKRLHDKMFYLYGDAVGLEDKPNDVYFLPNNLIQPTADSVGHIELTEYDGKTYKIPYATSAFAYHPNSYAHSCWGYHLYSLINYLCSGNKI